MKKLFRAQMDLFASPVEPPELTDAHRQKAVTLLRALLMEAVTNPADVTSSGSEKEAGDE
jgi:hypothetical protein